MDNASFIASSGPQLPALRERADQLRLGLGPDSTSEGIRTWTLLPRESAALFRFRLDPMLREEVLMTAPEAARLRVKRRETNGFVGVCSVACRCVST